MQSNCSSILIPFGDDLIKTVEDLKKANRLGNKVTPKQRVGPYQFQRGHVFRGTARGLRALDRGKQSNWKRRGPFLGAGRGLSRNYQNCQSYQNKQQFIIIINSYLNTIFIQ